MSKILPVVMAGGSGTRLWPLSRKQYPKQFLQLTSDKSMFQETLLRIPDHVLGMNHSFVVDQPIVVCNSEHRFIVAEQLRQEDLVARSIMLEPVGKNTAPAVALAAYEAQAEGDDPILLVLAADHVIRDSAAFHSSIALAATQAIDNKLVTFGIVPTAPETGYGYIKAGTLKDQGSSIVEEFVEKPDLETARTYLDEGGYFWNSGMFMFKASTYLDELQKYRPDIYEITQKAHLGKSLDLDFVRIDESEFFKCPDESIDYAVMEKTDISIVVPLDAEWSDVGSWSSLWEESDQDEEGNVIRGDVITHDCRQNLFYADHKLIAAVGVEDLIVIDTPDAVLVSAKERVQDVKHIVSKLANSERLEATYHREVARPWGSYDSIDVGHRFQVKRIKVKPGAKLSLQMHHHRAEHWIVVSGSALVTIDEKTVLLTENQSTYIPIGSKHRLENPGILPLEMIEVQSGSYLGEDDIVRFEDNYGR